MVENPIQTDCERLIDILFTKPLFYLLKTIKYFFWCCTASYDKNLKFVKFVKPVYTC